MNDCIEEISSSCVALLFLGLLASNNHNTTKQQEVCLHDTQIHLALLWRKQLIQFYPKSSVEVSVKDYKAHDILVVVNMLLFIKSIGLLKGMRLWFFWIKIHRTAQKQRKNKISLWSDLPVQSLYASLVSSVSIFGLLVKCCSQISPEYHQDWATNARPLPSLLWDKPSRYFLILAIPVTVYSPFCHLVEGTKKLDQNSRLRDGSSQVISMLHS